jgi:peptidoglycan/xylan/chitin deacetylase (PgdA/CDA1 family)
LVDVQQVRSAAVPTDWHLRVPPPRVVLSVALMLTAACSGGSGSKARPRETPATAATTVPPTAAPTTAPPTAPPPIPAVVANGPRDRPDVALTFDSNMTDAMLAELDSGKVASFANLNAISILEQRQVDATIFLAGKWIERYPDVTRRLATNPHLELGSHSYSHRAFHSPCYGLGALPAGEMAADVDHSEQLIRQFTEHATPYFRFPGGCYDEAALSAMAPTRVTVIQYDVASGDAFGTSTQAIVSNVLQNTKNGSIIVMHITDGNTAPLTDQALPAVVDGLRARGFRLVKVSELLRSTAP